MTVTAQVDAVEAGRDFLSKVNKQRWDLIKASEELEGETVPVWSARENSVARSRVLMGASRDGRRFRLDNAAALLLAESIDALLRGGALAYGGPCCLPLLLCCVA